MKVPVHVRHLRVHVSPMKQEQVHKMYMQDYLTHLQVCGDLLVGFKRGIELLTETKLALVKRLNLLSHRLQLSCLLGKLVLQHKTECSANWCCNTRETAQPTGAATQ